MNHDEQLFQRINQARAKFVAELRMALNAAGLREKGSYASLTGAQGGMIASLQNGASIEGYDIERLIATAATLRVALAPFDTSISRVGGQA